MRSYIQRVGINLYTDTFQILVKYDDHYHLEDVCADIYRKCVKSIKQKCELDDVEFTSYVEDIIGEDLEMKNIVLKKLTQYYGIERELDTEPYDKDVVMKKLEKLEAKEEENNAKVKRRFKDVENAYDSLKRKFKNFKEELDKCKNCRSVCCKSGDRVEQFQYDLKVKANNMHTCEHYISEEGLVIKEGTKGVMKDLGITWDDGSYCKCNSKSLDFFDIGYNC